MEPCLADCDYDRQPADVHMLGICWVIIQLQLRLLVWILCGTNLHKWDARVLKRCLNWSGLLSGHRTRTLMDAQCGRQNVACMCITSTSCMMCQREEFQG